ncbi:hypothetical protein THIOSC15_3530003 [uncultured Thiomicrorhabdus sp.]
MVESANNEVTLQTKNVYKVVFKKMGVQTKSFTGSSIF